MDDDARSMIAIFWTAILGIELTPDQVRWCEKSAELVRLMKAEGHEECEPL